MPISEQRAAQWLHTHAHSWPRNRPVSRRAILRGAAGAAGLAASFRLLTPLGVSASSEGRPKPINGLAPMFEVQPPAYKGEGRPAVFEQAVLTDFAGLVGSTDVTGWGVANDDLGEREMYFRCDMRFMKGKYIDTAGVERFDAFAFI